MRRQARHIRRAFELRNAVRTALTRVPGSTAVGAAAIALLTPGVSPALEVELSSFMAVHGGDGTRGFIVSDLERPIGSGAEVGRYVGAAGDINGDGVDDLIVSAFYYGQAFVVFGRDADGIGGFPPEFDLASLRSANGGDGTAGFVLNYPVVFGVSGVGDVNGDGVDDISVGGWPSYRRPGTSQTFVVFGHDARDEPFPAEMDLASLLPANGGDGSIGFVLTGQLNAALQPAPGGDINADGINELFLGDENGDAHGEHTGRTYVVFGRATRFPPVISLDGLLPAMGGDGSVGFVLEGMEAEDFAGADVSAADDIDFDGIDDVIIGAPGGNAGKSYVVFGRDTLQQDPFPPAFELSGLLAANGGDGSAGFVLHGDEYDDAGWAVSSADANGDGIADTIIGAEYWKPGVDGPGRAYVLFGRDRAQAGGLGAEFDLASLLSANGGDGSSGFVVAGVDPDEELGLTARGAGDVNGDGVADVLIGAPFASPDGRDRAGNAYVTFGHTASFSPEISAADVVSGDSGIALYGIDPADMAASSISAAGDINGDGVGDLVIGANSADFGRGEAYVVFGTRDFDRDGVSDDADNCSAAGNTDQRDTDGDHIGNACDPDLSNDCVVNFVDLGILKGVFFSNDPDADFDGDGAVNFVDLGIMKSAFFQAPGPSGLVNACEDTERRTAEDSASGFTRTTRRATPT